MVDLVLDASAAGKTMRNEPHAQALREHLANRIGSGSAFLVPPIFEIEIRNLAARTAQETGKHEFLFDHYKKVMDLVDPVPVDPAKDYSLAVKHRITVQDAQYVQVALDRDAVLVTYDKRQTDAARSSKARVLSPGKKSTQRPDAKPEE